MAIVPGDLTPRWAQIRRVALFLLGLAVIIDALADGEHLGQLVVGTLLVGLVPVDSVLEAFAGHRHGGDERN